MNDTSLKPWLDALETLIKALEAGEPLTIREINEAKIKLELGVIDELPAKITKLDKGRTSGTSKGQE